MTRAEAQEGLKSAARGANADAVRGVYQTDICPPCTGVCRQGRDCPGPAPDDAQIAARGIIVALLLSLVLWLALGVLGVLVWRAV
jgi:hypothetical protein